MGVTVYELMWGIDKCRVCDVEVVASMQSPVSMLMIDTKARLRIGIGFQAIMQD